MHVTAYNPLVGQAQQLPVGLAALRVPALAGLSTGLPAPGAPFTLGCGQGPPVTVDGHTYPTSVSGTASDLTNLTPLPLQLCTNGSMLPLAAGRHWLTSPGTGVPLTVTDLSLRPATASPAAPPHAAAVARTCGSARGEPSTVPRRSARAASRTWRFTRWPTQAGPPPSTGYRLTPVTLDGWQQAFLVPARAGHVVMAFTPATGYRWLLAGSAVAICVLIAAAAWPSAAVRAGRTAPGRVCARLGTGSRWPPRAWCSPWWPGPLVAAVPVVLMLGRWRPRWVPWLAFAAMCVAGALAMTSLGHGPQAGAGAFGWPAQAAALIALAAALTPTGHRTRGTGQPR